jgi:hypothetical protein
MNGCKISEKSNRKIPVCRQAGKFEKTIKGCLNYLVKIVYE